MYLLLKVYDALLSEDDLRRKGLNSVPDDLYNDSEASGLPDITGVTQFVRGPHPLSPAETGHYHYNRRWPGMNVDASGSYRREEVLPQPQRVAGEKIFTTD
jgi:hypothetical protein